MLQLVLFRRTTSTCGGRMGAHSSLVPGSGLATNLLTTYPQHSRVARYRDYPYYVQPNVPATTFWAAGCCLSTWMNNVSPFYDQSNGEYNRPLFAISAVPDSDVSAFDILPIPVYALSSTYTSNGLKGVMRDLWWGATGGSRTLYPSSGTAQFVQLGDVIVPWTAGVDPLFY